MRKWICTVCQYVYDPAIGDPEHGIAPGTDFEDLPDDWLCPKCLLLKNVFVPLEEWEAGGTAGGMEY